MGAIAPRRTKPHDPTSPWACTTTQKCTEPAVLQSTVDCTDDPCDLDDNTHGPHTHPVFHCAAKAHQPKPAG